MTILERRQRLQERRRFFTMSSIKQFRLRNNTTTQQLQLLLIAKQNASTTTKTTNALVEHQHQQQPTAIRKLFWKLQRNYQKRCHSMLDQKKLLYIDSTSYAVMKLEIQYLLLPLSNPYAYNGNDDIINSVDTVPVVTPLSMVNALLGSRNLFNVYAESSTTTMSFQNDATFDATTTTTPIVRRFGDTNGRTTTSYRARGAADSSTQRRYDLVNTLNQLQQQVSSMTEPITSWDDAIAILSRVLHLPVNDDDNDSNCNDYNRFTSSTRLESTVGTTDLIDTTNNDTNAVALSANGTLSLLSSPSIRTTSHINKTNNGSNNSRTEMFLQRLRDIKIDEMSPPGLRPSQHKWLEIANASLSKYSDDVIDESKIEVVESTKVACRELTDEEQEQINNVMTSGRGTDIVAQTEDGTDSVQRMNLRTLLPMEWVNDEVIHFFLYLLQQRDEQLCSRNDNTDHHRKRSHFFKSFFMTKLLNEGHINPALDGVYNYTNVKRWSKKVPGKDIFALDKIILPINRNNSHWTTAVVYMQEQRIQYYDSMGGSGQFYLTTILQYLQDEHVDKKKTPMKSPELWTLVPCTNDTPRQQNCNDCGVFTCMFADFFSIDRTFHGLDTSEDDMLLYRQHIALSILNGQIVS